MEGETGDGASSYHVNMPVFLRWLVYLIPLNPIAVRLVQNGSRRTRHLYIRAAYLAVLILVLLWSLIARLGGGELDYRELAINAAASFTFIAYLQLALICILAPVFMAGAIAQEASPRTWEVLLTTPLTAGQIVLGNLLGRLFFIISLMVATLPLFALTQYFGGVSMRAIFGSFAISAFAVLLVGTIAIALSVSRLAGKRAVFAFYVCVISYLAVTAGVDAFLRNAGHGAAGGGGVTWMTAINPFLALAALLNPTDFPTAPEGTTTGLRNWFLEHPVRTWCYGSLLLSVLLMVVSTFTVRSGGLNLLSGEEGGIPWYRKLFGLGAAGAETRPARTVWHNPIAWREAAARNSTLGRIVARYAFIGLGGLFGVALVVLYHTGSMTHGDFRGALLATVWGELGVITLVAINMAATAISREREDGTLDLLLTTPITPSSYLFGKLRGLISYLLPLLAVPLGTLALASFYVLLGGLGRAEGVSVTTQVPGAGAISVPVVLPEAGIVAPVVVLPFIAFCVMVGLQWSLRSKGTISSVVATVGVVGAVAGMSGLCGWQAALSVAWIGPALGALCPGPLIFALVSPENAMSQTVSGGGGLETARISLAIGAVAAAVIYCVVVYAIQSGLVRTFDMTVRKLAGVR